MLQLEADTTTGPSTEPDGRRRRTRPRARHILGIVAIAAVVAVILSGRGWWADSSTPRRADPSPAAAGMPTSAAIESTYGIRFLGVDVTAGGGMIELRYQILDNAKTAAVHDAETAPFVVDSRGVHYADPGMVGHTHVGTTKSPGTTDYILLANSRGGVQPGSMVTIRIGSLELRDVPVL